MLERYVRIDERPAEKTLATHGHVLVAHIDASVCRRSVPISADLVEQVTLVLDDIEVIRSGVVVFGAIERVPDRQVGVVRAADVILQVCCILVPHARRSMKWNADRVEGGQNARVGIVTHPKRGPTSKAVPRTL